MLLPGLPHDPFMTTELHISFVCTFTCGEDIFQLYSIQVVLVQPNMHPHNNQGPVLPSSVTFSARLCHPLTEA